VYEVTIVFLLLPCIQPQSYGKIVAQAQQIRGSKWAPEK